MGPDDDRGRANANNSTTKKDAAMQLVVRDNEMTAKTMMRVKILFMVKMLMVVEVMAVEMAAARV
jgi:hypothetical protein